MKKEARKWVELVDLKSIKKRIDLAHKSQETWNCLTLRNIKDRSEIEHTRAAAAVIVRTMPDAAYGPRRYKAI